MDVGIVTTHVPPAQGYGGVSVTCGVLTRAWAASGHDMALVASDESIAGRLRPDEGDFGAKVDVGLLWLPALGLWPGCNSQIIQIVSAGSGSLYPRHCHLALDPGGRVL